MGLFDQFPYTNFHELNLDWLIKLIKELENTVNNFVALNTIKYADPIQWNITTQYEANTVVVDPQDGTAYISSQAVPVGVALTNTDYWSVIFTLDIISANKNLTLRDDGSNVLATFASNADDWLIWNGTLYKVSQAINVNEAYVVGYNLTRYTVELFINDYVTELTTIIGDLANLTTSDTSSIVNAINSLDQALGDLANLTTSDTSSIVNAINSLNQALTDKINNIRYFDNVSAMLADPDLNIGDHAITLGYYAKGDKGAATYVITNNAANGYDNIAAANGTATLISNRPTMNQLGCSPDLTNNAPIINGIMHTLQLKDVIFEDGIYEIQSAVSIGSYTANVGADYFIHSVHNVNLKYTGPTLNDYVLLICGIYNGVIENVTLDCNDLCGGIQLYYSQNTKFENIFVNKCIAEGLRHGASVNGRFSNITIYGSITTIPAVLWREQSSDSDFDHIEMANASAYAIDYRGANCTFTKVQIWNYSAIVANQTTCGINIAGNSIDIYGIIMDSISYLMEFGKNNASINIYGISVQRGYNDAPTTMTLVKGVNHTVSGYIVSSLVIPASVTLQAFESLANAIAMWDDDNFIMNLSASNGSIGNLYNKSFFNSNIERLFSAPNPNSLSAEISNINDIPTIYRVGYVTGNTTGDTNSVTNGICVTIGSNTLGLQILINRSTSTINHRFYTQNGFSAWF